MKLVGVLFARRAGTVVTQHAEGLGFDPSFLQFGIEGLLGLFDLCRGIGTHPSVAQHFGGFDVLDLNLFTVSSGGSDFGVLVEESHVDLLHLVTLVFHLHFHRSRHGDVLLFDVAEESPERHAAATRGDGSAVFGVGFFGNLIVGPGGGPTFGQWSFRLVGGFFDGSVLSDAGRGRGQKEKSE